MKVNCKFELKEITGEVMRNADGTPFTIGQAIAKIITSCVQTDALRAMVLGSELYKAETITLNDSDMTFIKDSMKSSPFPAIITGQVLIYLKDVESEKE